MNVHLTNEDRAEMQANAMLIHKAPWAKPAAPAAIEPAQSTLTCAPCDLWLRFEWDGDSAIRTSHWNPDPAAMFAEPAAPELSGHAVNQKLKTKKYGAGVVTNETAGLKRLEYTHKAINWDGTIEPMFCSVWLPKNDDWRQYFKRQQHARNRYSRNFTLYHPKYVMPWRPDSRPKDAVTVPLSIPWFTLTEMKSLFKVLGLPCCLMPKITWHYVQIATEETAKILQEKKRRRSRAKPITHEQFEAVAATHSEEPPVLEALYWVLVLEESAGYVADQFGLPENSLKSKAKRWRKDALRQPETVMAARSDT